MARKKKEKPFVEMDETDFENWVEKERNKVELYLNAQGIMKPNVGPWPAFEAAPYFAIWAVESKKVAGKIGWWAFSGDCPTDYVSEDGKCHPRNALKILIEKWKSFIPYLKKGKQPPDNKFGEGNNLKLLGDLLETRVSILEGWLSNDELWTES